MPSTRRSIASISTSFDAATSERLRTTDPVIWPEKPMMPHTSYAGPGTVFTPGQPVAHHAIAGDVLGGRERLNKDALDVVAHRFDARRQRLFDQIALGEAVDVDLPLAGVALNGLAEGLGVPHPAETTKD